MVLLKINIIDFKNQHWHVDFQHFDVENQHISKKSTYGNVDFQHTVFFINMNMLINNINT